LNCRKANSLLSAYIDGELPGVEQMQVRTHIRDCRCCSDEHESLLLTKRMLSGVSMQAPRVCLEERILNRIGEENGAGSSWHNIHGWWSLLPEGQRSQVRVLSLFGVFCALAFFYVMRPLSQPITNAQLARDLPRYQMPPATLEPSPRVDDYLRFQLHSQSGQPFSGGPAAVPASFQSEPGP